MKRWNLKSFVLGVLVATLILGFAAPAMASTLKTAELYYNDIKIRLNGAELTPKDVNGNIVEPFVIDGTTYLPIRAVASALGLSVDWDGATQTVVLGNDPEYGQPAAWLGDLETFVGDVTWYVPEYKGVYNHMSTANDGSTYDRYWYPEQDKTSYFLKGQYSSFTGTFYLASGDKDETSSAYFEVFLDGELAFTSKTLTSGELPQEFNVNVHNVYQMDIVYHPTLWRTSYATTTKVYHTTPIGNAALWTD